MRSDGGQILIANIRKKLFEKCWVAHRTQTISFHACSYVVPPTFNEIRNFYIEKTQIDLQVVCKELPLGWRCSTG